MGRNIQIMGRWSVAALLVSVLAACTSGSAGSGSSPGASSAESAGPAAASPVSAYSNVPTVLVIDSSGSMATDDAPGVRLEAAKEAAGVLIDSLPPETTFGALAYGANTTNEDTPENKARSCADISAVVPFAPVSGGDAKASIAALQPGGYTPIGAALTAAAGMVPSGQSTIVLITDGIDTCAPPDACETARGLKGGNAELIVSVVGLHADDAQLQCIADATGGLFVTADNAAQLAARLKAVRLVDTAGASLTPTGFAGIHLGASIADIRRTHPDFPNTGTPRGNGVVIVWRDCNYTFTDGFLTEIAPTQVRTIDGLSAGAPLTDAVALYGDPEQSNPVSSGGATSLFRVGNDGTAWKITTDASGKIVQVSLCRCLATVVTTYAVTAADAAKAQCGVCTLTDSTVIDHPTWGTVTLATFANEPNSGLAAVVAFNGQGSVVWRQRLVQSPYEYGFAEPAQDSTGNVFLHYNPGRYNGIGILRPSRDGFDVIATSFYERVDDPNSWPDAQDFYYAELSGPGANGQYTIIQNNNSCTPSCAEGAITSAPWIWDSTQVRYVPSS